MGEQDLPIQGNGADCGVFTVSANFRWTRTWAGLLTRSEQCQFMESLSRGVEEFDFVQDQMP